MKALTLHPEFSMQVEYFGAEKQPIVVVDNFIAEADELRHYAEQQDFQRTHRFYPGVRAETPEAYQQLFLSTLGMMLVHLFKLPNNQLKLSTSSFSIVTTAPRDLQILQRIPHVDSANMNELACVHYLSDMKHGGTSFYRQKNTDFEFVDEARQVKYREELKAHAQSGHVPEAQYINGDTPIFERIKQYQGVYNRLIVYRKTSLHSGDMQRDFEPPQEFRDARLSINSFIECAM